MEPYRVTPALCQHFLSFFFFFFVSPLQTRGTFGAGCWVKKKNEIHLDVCDGCTTTNYLPNSRRVDPFANVNIIIIINNNMWSISGSLLVSHFRFYFYLFRGGCSVSVFHLYWDDRWGAENLLDIFLCVCARHFIESSSLPHRISHSIEYRRRLISSCRTKTTCSIRH